MKKTFYLITAIILSSIMLVGCTADQQAFWDAYLQTGEITSYSADMTMSLSVDLGENLSPEDLMAKEMLDNATFDVSMKYLKQSDQAVLIEADAVLNSNELSYEFNLWYDIDLSDVENPKALIIYKFPENLDGMPDFDYFYLDAAEMFSELSKEQQEEYFALMTSDNTKFLELVSDVDFSEINVKKEGEKYIVSISNEIIAQYFEAIFGIFAKSFTEFDEESTDLMQDELKKSMEMLINSKFFGEDGITADFTIDQDGFIKDMATIINLNLDRELTGADSDVKLALDLKTSYYEYNAIEKIELPELTDENSVSLMDMMSQAAEMERDEIIVIIGPEIINFDVPPVKVNDRTMVPMRKIFETLGAQVEYEDSTKLITATAGDKIVKHTVGENVVYVNDEVLEMDVASFETGGRTLVPVRFISNALGAEVLWNEELQIVEIILE